MEATAYASPDVLFGARLPKVRKTEQRWLFGDIALVAFLLAQCLDGVFTYVGVVAFGIGVEANPLVAGLMTHLGHGPGILSAKMLAALLGISLHLRQVHHAVAVLTGFYVAAAIGPWALILFF
jgi:uncharacterized protein DUF5658